MKSGTLPLSILDLAYVRRGFTPAEALQSSLELARHAEICGYHRFWLAEHHNMVGIASAATSVFIGYIAGGTSSIRVGAGGVMLPNHSPLVIAEQFGTLESLYPGRIDLGLGRAPGTDGITLRALRRNVNSADTFPQDVVELQSYFKPAQPGQPVQAVPGAGLPVPLWILGSSLFGARLAAQLGLPYAFAAHFAPADLMAAVKLYRENFQPSEQLKEPYLMVAANITVAETEERAAYLFTSTQQAYIGILTNQRSLLAPPVADINALLSPQIEAHLDHMLGCSMVGTPETVGAQLSDFVDKTGADEIMAVASVYDQKERLRSFELLAEIGRDL
ncbi:MAG: LLM class flavin-dependent oxidoreductase [Porticoccaceae bacterium]|nr:LLM class flavin-dependent oxidoreductase [Pseudomonadales bacterium]